MRYAFDWIKDYEKKILEIEIQKKAVTSQWLTRYNRYEAEIRALKDKIKAAQDQMAEVLNHDIPDNVDS